MRSPGPQRLTAATRATISELEVQDKQEAEARRAANRARAQEFERKEAQRRVAALKAHQELVMARREVEYAELDFEAEVIRVRCGGVGTEADIEAADARLARARRDFGFAEIVYRNFQHPGFR